MTLGRLGGCQLHRVQSHSNHSQLYRAYSEELQANVMIKVLAARYPANSHTAQRFVRGGKLAMSLEHPNIIRTFACGDDRGRPYMLMEFLDGHSLDRILKVRDRIPWELAIGIVRQVAKALDLGKQKNVVHRNLDPSHIMLSPGGRATVLGFGMARLSESTADAITAEGALINVTAYTPPETGEGIQDIRGDLYSLGCVFYHLLSGRPPFANNDPLALLHAHRTEGVWPLNDLVQNLPDAVFEIINILMARELPRRLRTPAELIALIDVAINPELLDAQGVKPDKTMVASTMQMLAVRSNYTVLLCDDQQRTIEGIDMTLQRTGVNTLTTRDGNAIGETLANREIDLLITDLKVPGLAGENLLRTVAAVNPSLPILLTRRGPLVERIYKAKQYNIIACLDRPLDLFALRRTVREEMQRHMGS